MAQGYYLDSVGRRRKLSGGAIKDIQRSFYEGEPAVKLAEAYGVSVGLIRSAVYNTPREKDLDRMEEEPH